MSTFDIRTNAATLIDTIIFCKAECYSVPDGIRHDKACKTVDFVNTEDNDVIFSIDYSDVPHLIKALQKSIELGWTSKPVVFKAPAKKPVVKAK